MQTNPVWRMVRALIVTYILSGILLVVLSFAPVSYTHLYSRQPDTFTINQLTKQPPRSYPGGCFHICFLFPGLFFRYTLLFPCSCRMIWIS